MLKQIFGLWGERERERERERVENASRPSSRSHLEIFQEIPLRGDDYDS